MFTNKYQHSEDEAFEAMFRFLEEYSRRGPSEGLLMLLADLNYVAPGSTADPAQWVDWMRNVEAVLAEREKNRN